MPSKNLKRLLPFLLLLLLTGCGPEEESVTPHVVGPPRPGSWLSVHKTPPSAPTGAAAIGSAGDSKALFVDIARASGINYRWSIPGPHPLDILQTIGNGCALLDYNHSGQLSALLIGTDHIALFQGEGHGHFRDMSHALGLDTLKGHFLGCAVGDYDNDGYEDVYVSGYRTGLLLHNDGGKRFRDVTQAAGLKPQPWGTSAAFAETTPGSGRLDLYVGNYLQFDPKTSQRLCQKDAQQVACSPTEYLPEHGVFYRNEGRGKFREATREWNLQAGAGKTLGVAFADFNGCGRPSLYLANDEEQGDLFENQGKTFRNRGSASGTAYDGRFRVHAGMGTDWGDYDNDSRLDLFADGFQGEPKSAFHNEGSGLFQDRSSGLLLATPTLPYVAFGGKWLDYDNDGWLDLMIANGHVYDNIAAVDKTAAYREPTQLFHNDKGRLLVDMSGRAGAALPRAIVGRGLATGDFDNDGRMDALVVDSEGTPLLLHNESAPVGHWLSLKLVGTKSNRDGIGALVTITAGGLAQTRLCHTDGSYLSASDVRVFAGLGKATIAETIIVKWPSGHKDTLRHIKSDQTLTVHEGNSRKE